MRDRWRQRAEERRRQKNRSGFLKMQKCLKERMMGACLLMCAALQRGELLTFKTVLKRLNCTNNDKNAAACGCTTKY